MGRFVGFLSSPASRRPCPPCLNPPFVGFCRGVAKDRAITTKLELQFTTLQAEIAKRRQMDALLDTLRRRHVLPRACAFHTRLHLNPPLFVFCRGIADVGDSGVDLLLIAAAMGLRNSVEGLLDAGVDINSRRHGWSALSLAAFYDRGVVVELLLEHWANVNFAGVSTCLPYDPGMESGTLAECLDRSDTHCDCEPKHQRYGSNHNGTTALHLAAAKGHVKIAEILLQNNAKKAEDSEGRTAFILAAKNGREGIVQLLLEQDTPLWASKRDRTMALELAKDGGHDGVVEQLARLGGAANDQHMKWNPVSESLSRYMDLNVTFLSAAEQGDATTIRILLDYKAESEASDDRATFLKAHDRDGNTALIWASRKGCVEICRLLLDRGADLEAEDVDKKTALIWASQLSHEQICRMLLDRGAHLEATDKHGHTALLWAAKRGAIDLTQRLLGRHANIDATTKDGWTALMYAVNNDNVDMVQLLLEGFAMVKLRSHDGKSALDLTENRDLKSELHKWDEIGSRRLSFKQVS